MSSSRDDYVWVQSLTHYSAAHLTNDKGSYRGAFKKGATYSKIELTHKGSTQVYSVEMKIPYDEVDDFSYGSPSKTSTK